MPNKQLLQSAGDGTAVPAGYVGQIIQANPAANVTLQTSGNFKDLCSITLTPGVWIVSGTSALSTTGGTVNRIGAAISTTSNGTDTTGSSSISILSQSASGGGHYINCGVRYLNVSSNTTVYLEGFVDYSVAGSMQWLVVSNIQAIRIA